jgi:cobyrinic acid a,c-diamide synthase
MAARCRTPIIGTIARDEGITLAERHLGLVMASEGGLTPEKRTRLADRIERSLVVTEPRGPTMKHAGQPDDGLPFQGADRSVEAAVDARKVDNVAS